MVRFGQKIRRIDLHVADLHTVGQAVLGHVLAVILRQRFGSHRDPSQVIRGGEKDDLGGKLFVLLAVKRLGFPRRDQAAAQAGEHRQMLNPHLVPDKPDEVRLAVAVLTQLLLNKVLVSLHPEGAAGPVPERVGDPVCDRVVADLDVQLVDFFDQEDPFQRLAVRVEHLPAAFILFRPAPVIDKKPQARLAFHLGKFLLAKGPPVNGTVVARTAAENAAPPTRGGIEKLDHADDDHGCKNHHQPLLMTPNVSKHKSTSSKF